MPNSAPMPAPGPTRMSVPATPIAPALTRASLRSLEPVVGRQRLPDLLLLATEVVANAVRHAGPGAGGDIEVAVDVQPGSVRVAVRDPGPGFALEGTPEPQSGRDPYASGWGLYLVDTLAQRWGVERKPNGTVVWFELDVERR